MAETWTIRRILGWMAEDFGGRGMSSPRLDAELIVAHALGSERIQLYLDLDRPLEAKELTAIRELVARRRRFEPVAYLVGKKEFFGRTFQVGPAVLVPRPDTETIVERALALLPNDVELRVLDLCTGSGAIGISLAAERPLAKVDLTDVSPEAVAVARANADTLGVGERVRVLAGDLFAALPGDARYLLITANPPYIAEGDRERLPADVADHEPHVALFGGPDGLDLVRRIAAGAAAHLEPGGTLLCEIGAEQSVAAIEIVRTAGFDDVRTHRDLAGIERVVEGRRPGTP